LTDRPDETPEAALERVDADARRAFGERYPGLRVAPVVVVIAALNEEASIRDVLDGIPREVGGLEVGALVVDDGSTDATGAVASEHGALVARLERNSGQGAAFRVGYRLALEHGARFLVTLDGDGQWDPGDVPGVLQPVIDGEADFVLGSRVLGTSESDDTVRQAGVHVFATLVRVLTGVRVTDTSSGLRAMLAEVPANVRLDQPQYQSSELLLGAIFAGYRLAERPVVMHKRTAGVSKKGGNALYGLRYARVILRTWWRARRLAGEPRRVVVDRPRDLVDDEPVHPGGQ
jgi:glycosyltransferase involved in cell wall biosynthesis